MTLAVAVATAAATVAIPAGAHVTRKAGHNWHKHYKKLARKIFFTKKQSNNRFYPRAEANENFASAGHDHDGRYFTETEADQRFAPVDQGDLCRDGAVTRQIERPGVGELVLTEVMADPFGLSDPDAEWFEVLVLADVDMNGVGIGKEIGGFDPGMPSLVLHSEECLEVAADDHMLFVRSADPTLNGGLTPDHVFSFTLPNSGTALFLSSQASVLDQINLGTATAGLSRQLDSSVPSAAANDDAAVWCDGQDEYTPNNFGTPGFQNQPCP